MASELASHKVVETIPPAQIFPALPPGQSFQDLPSSDDEDDDEDDNASARDSSGQAGEPDSDDDRRIQELIDAIEPVTEQETNDMTHFLKERGLFAFVKRYVQELEMPLPRLLLSFGVLIPPETTPENQIRILKITLSRILRNRDRIESLNTVDDVVELIRKSSNILLLTGAGVSMFDLPYFREKPNIFYSFAKEIYPSNFTPSPCHRFVKMLEQRGRLLRNYTQNIDGLFESIGVERLLNCHGSFATASCLRCRTKFPGSAIEADVFAQRVPLCPLCSARDEEEAKIQPVPAPAPLKWKANGKGFEDDSADERPPPSEWEGKPLIKPDIVFFGEMLSDEFDRCLLHDREQVDLLIVIGTSLRVAPVSQLVSHVPHSVPQILINRDPVSHHNFDVVLLGDGDTIVKHLTHKLGTAEWSLPVPRQLADKPDVVAHELSDETTIQEPKRVSDSHVWLFNGANREHRWVQLVREAFESEDEEEDESAHLAPTTDEASRQMLNVTQSIAPEASNAPALATHASALLPTPLRDTSRPSSRPRSPSESPQDATSKKFRVDED
ncbi:NAD-dependent histone deacetylase sir2 [Microbotryomycetes sp. JL221]|nr:NAD-dependent histone deacetylase sir2 [Microbotryomycetes sp. JL221]